MSLLSCLSRVGFKDKALLALFSRIIDSYPDHAGERPAHR